MAANHPKRASPAGAPSKDRRLDMKAIAGRASPRVRLALLWALMLASAAGLVPSSPATAAAVEGSCLVVDSDAGLDDFRAIAALAAWGPRGPAQRIAAVVVTEGLARVPEGAGA